MERNYAPEKVAFRPNSRQAALGMAAAAVYLCTKNVTNVQQGILLNIHHFGTPSYWKRNIRGDSWDPSKVLELNGGVLALDVGPQAKEVTEYSRNILFLCACTKCQERNRLYFLYT